jgi:hypothetical protein
MGAIRRYAWVVFILFAAMATLFGVFPGTWFDDTATDDQKMLVSTYAALAVVLTVAVVLGPFRRGERWAWAVLWVWPAFFGVHGIVYFAFDFVFAAVGALALAATAPRTAAAASAAASSAR